MPAAWLKPSPVLHVEHFRDPDAYRAHEVLGGGTSTPLHPHNFLASRGTLASRHGQFVLQRSFARNLQADLGPERGLGLFVPVAFNCTINGQSVDNSTIGLMRGRTPVEVIEQRSNTYLMLRFDADMRERGWPDDKRLQYVRVDQSNMDRLRTAVLGLFSLASACRDCPEDLARIDRAVEEDLICTLDEALAPDVLTDASAGSYDRHRKVADRLDELIEAMPTEPLYSEALARACAVSVRTLQSAVHAIHGMRLHAYIQLKRMWAARRQLGIGHPGCTVKSVAMAHGFRHMGEFSRAYRAIFGEAPSDTLAQAQGLGLRRSRRRLS